MDKGFKAFAELFKDKFKEMLELELEVKEVEEKKKVINSSKKQQQYLKTKITFFQYGKFI